MYLSRLILDGRCRQVQRDIGDCQQLHRTILSAFPQAESSSPRASFGILFRVEPGSEGTAYTVLVQSSDPPDWSRLPGDYLLAPSGAFDNPACKPLGPLLDSLKEGTACRFRLRANPTKRIDTKTGPDGRRRNGRRVPLLGNDALVEWLVRKGREHCGFELWGDETGGPSVIVRMEGRRTGARRGITGVADDLTFGSVLFDGVLVIREVMRFKDAMAKGIGSGKSYGFGLLSIAVPGRPTGEGSARATEGAG